HPAQRHAHAALGGADVGKLDGAVQERLRQHRARRRRPRAEVGHPGASGVTPATTMEIGCHLPTQGPVATRDALLTFAQQAEKHRIASLWVSDHVIFPRSATGNYPGGRFPHPPDKPYLEPVATLAAAALITTHARLGASVFILGHLTTVVRDKLLSTFETPSPGRLLLVR